MPESRTSFSLWTAPAKIKPLYKWLIVIVLLGVYFIFLPWALQQWGDFSRLFTLFFILPAVFFWGLRGGIIIAVLTPIPVIFFSKFLGVQFGGGLIGPLFLLLIVTLLGRLRDLSLQLERELERKVQEESELQNHKIHLEEMIGQRTVELSNANLELQREISDRIQVENALRESESRYRTFFEKGPDGIVVLDTKTAKIIEFNDQACRQLGYSRDEFALLRVSDIEARETARETHARIRKVMHKGYDDFETLQRTKQGEIRHVHVTAQVVEIAGKPVYHCIWRDITERRYAEDTILKERDYISKVLYWIDSLVIVTSVEGYIISFNRASEQLSGYRLEELQGAPFWETLLAPDEREGVKAVIKDVLHKELSKDFRNHWVTKTGQKRLIQWNNSVLRKADGTAEYILCTGIDITERQKTETALKESEAKYRELVQNANSIIARIDPNGTIVFFNEYAESFFGYAAGEIIGKNIVGTIVPRTDSFGRNLATLFSDIIKQPEQYATYENENMLRNGQRVWVAWTNKAIYDRKGGIKEILCIGNDITERKRLETELQQAQKMDALGTLSGGIAHEFNNILDIIIGNIELALDDASEWDPARDYLQEIRIASLRARDVVRQIMSFSRKIPATRKPVQFKALIQEALKLTRTTIPANIEIRQEYLCGDEMILANPTEINQVFINLCSNSVHAMEGETGLLAVRLESVVLDDRGASRYERLTSGEYVKLTIRDNGTGIDPKIRGLVFDPYFTTKDIDKGLGMGLSVVYGIVKKHEGAIKLASQVDKGTTVEVLFPVTQKPASIEEPAPAELPPGTEQILFVDDEASIVKMVTQMLERQGYQVVGQTSSVAALKLFQKEPDRFDLVITDMAMPEMPGDRLAKELLKIRPAIPVVVCTGHSDRMDEDKAIKLGIAAYAMKPLVKKDLLGMVRKVLEDEPIPDIS